MLIGSIGRLSRDLGCAKHIVYAVATRTYTKSVRAIESLIGAFYLKFIHFIVDFQL